MTKGHFPFHFKVRPNNNILVQSCYTGTGKKMCKSNVLWKLSAMGSSRHRFCWSWKIFNIASDISISQDLNTYFPSKQAYFRYKEPWQWTTMSPKNKSSLKAELLEMWRCCSMHTQKKNHLFHSSTQNSNYFYHILVTLSNSGSYCLKAFWTRWNGILITPNTVKQNT